jgi:sugar lactone lactonase YvrE
VSNKRDFAAVPQDAGLPDGLIADAEDCLWSAHWGGWRVTRYRPDGKIDRVVKLPAANVTCMAFGGKQLDELYITTASFFLNEQQRKQQPQAGDLFRAYPGVAGVAEPPFAG